MHNCRICDSPVADDANFCEHCGCLIIRNEENIDNAPVIQVPPVYNMQQVQPPQDNGYSPYVDISGLLAWSIVCMIFCLPFGLIALTTTLSINGASSQEEAERRKRKVKTVCTVGTFVILAIVLLLVFLISA